MYFRPKNEVNICGKVVNIYHTNEVTIITFDCSRKNYPKIVVPKKLLLENPNITEGCILTVFGCLRNNLPGCGKTTFSILAEEIEVIDDEPVMFRNEFYLTAEIEHVRKSYNKVIVSTKVDCDGTISYIPVTLPMSALKQIDIIEKGKCFRCCGFIRTGKTFDENGVCKYFEEYIAQGWIFD